MTDISETGKRHSKCTTLKAVKVGKTKLATHNSYAIASCHRHRFSSFTFAVEILFENRTLPHYSCLLGVPLEALHLHITVALGLNTPLVGDM